MNRRWVWALVVIAATAPRAFAGKHPVPLDPKTDAKKCLECHEDKTKGKSVHTAMQGGCLSCHELRVTKEATRIKLTTTTPAALCLTCHADKNAAELKGRVHNPAVRDCLKCHDPHSSENKNQLLLAASGDTKKENLCLSCHNTGVNVAADGSRHAALDMGCDTCHVTHKVGDRSKTEFAYHLAKATPQLCLDCHDAKDASLIKAHRNQPFATADCLTCHDPHQSAVPKLMQADLHPPFAEKNCDTCHDAPKDGKVVLTQESSKALCLTCHEEQGKKIESAKVQHPGAMGDCIDCHSPHASRSPGLPKTAPVAVCLGCHADIAEQGQKAHPHQPAFEQRCSICHEPHGGDNPKLLRASDTNALCMECHGPDAKPAVLASTHQVTIFDGKVRLPEDYFRKVVRLPLKYGRGHPVDKHPVVPLDRDSNVQGAKTMACLACHQPHSSAQPNLLVKDQTNNTAFCATCHTSMQAGSQ